MKLRIKGNSLRLRVSRSELARFLREGEIEETIHFAPAADAKMTYALRRAPAGALSVVHEPQKVTVSVPASDAQRWAGENEVGIYGGVDNGHGLLDLAIEKDFACVEASEADNEDTFANPQASVTTGNSCAD